MIIFSPARCACTGSKGKSVILIQKEIGGKIPREILNGHIKVSLQN